MTLHLVTPVNIYRVDKITFSGDLKGSTVLKLFLSGSYMKKSKSEHEKLNEKRKKKVFGIKLSNLFSSDKNKSKEVKEMANNSATHNKSQHTSTPFKINMGVEADEEVNNGASKHLQNYDITRDLEQFTF